MALINAWRSRTATMRQRRPGVAPSVKRSRLRHGHDARGLRRSPAHPGHTLRNWEQGRVAPDPAARALFTVLAKNPKVVLDTLADAPQS